MIPLFKVRMSDRASEDVAQVLASGFIGQGTVVDQFEDQLWVALGTRTKPVTVNSCTAAIDLALELINLQPGDEVITTPQTCFATNVGPIHRGAVIKWADIDPFTGLIDPISVKKLITPKTNAIIGVNWAGKFCDYAALKKHGIPVIEDAAHSWESFIEDKNSLDRGDYICYSFQAIKFLTAGDGGILVCPKKDIPVAKMLRWYGLDRTKNESFRCTQNITRAGFKYHMNNINAAIGIANIPEAADSVIKARENSAFYIKHVHNKNYILPQWDEKHSYWLFSMHILQNKRDQFVRYMREFGVEASPVHFRNDQYDCTAQYSEGPLLGVDAFSKTQICIPNGWWLTPTDRDHITKLLVEFD